MIANRCCRILFFLIIFTIPPPSLAQKDKNGNEHLSATVFKFIYDNEQICGDMFANSSWLPAHQNCELKCRMDSEICQMSSEMFIIRRQRCHELPIECRRRLKQLLGGAELFTKPKRREGPISPTAKLAKSKMAKGHQHIQGTIKEREKPSSVAIVRDPPSPLPFSPPLPQPPRQIHISPSSRTSLKMNTPSPIPELVPLSLDKEILIPPDQLHTTTTTSVAIKTNIATNLPLTSLKNSRPPSGPIQLPTQNKEQSKQPSSISTSPPKSGKKKEKVDDSLQIAYQNLYMDSSKATSPSRIGSRSSTAIQPGSSYSSTITNLKATTKSTPLQIPKSHLALNSFESAELGQPFAGNPFATNPTAGVPTELSVLSAPLLTQLQQQQHLPKSSRENIDEGKEGQQQRQNYEVFGPPINRKQLEQEIGNGKQQLIQIHQLPLPAIQPSGYFPQTMPPSSTSGSKQIVGDSKQKKEQRDEKKVPSSLEKKDGKTGGGQPKQYNGKSMPWWAWRILAENIRNNKKPNFFNAADATAAAFISLDKTVQCCQWALDGLCDRSWQRIRELCPKSCGNVVCSSIDGTLSCNRLVNVDVIACYEQRRIFQRHQFLAAPTLKMLPSVGEALDMAPQGMEQFTTNGNGNIMMKTEEQRAFAIEEEIKGLLGIMKGRMKEEEREFRRKR